MRFQQLKGGKQMAEVKVTKENGGALARRPEVYFPTFPFNLFEHNPFGMMKRFTEEMDRAFANFGATPEFDLWAPALRSQAQGW
jgi:hypothetical protein